MTNIKIDMKALEEPIKKSNNLAERTDNLLNEFNSQKICIDNIICERDNIRYDLNEISKEIKFISERFTKYGKQINGVINAYEYAERKLEQALMVLESPRKDEKSNSDIKPANVTVGNVKVGNTMVSNGTTTGNLIDIVKGLGGTVSWDEISKIATVIINGKTTRYNLNNIKDGIGYASDGSIFTVKDGHIQVGIREISEKAGANVKWSPTSVGVKVDVDYTYASVSRTIKVTKDNGQPGELWVSDKDRIMIFEQKGNRSHVRYPVGNGYDTAWVDTGKLNIGVKVTSGKQVTEPTLGNVQSPQNETHNCLISASIIEAFINSHSGLSNIQKKILREGINRYANYEIIKEHYIDNRSTDPLVMFFEGAMDDKEGNKPTTNTYGIDLNYHKDGRYKAMAVVIKDGQIDNVFTDASTLPDLPDNNTHISDYGKGKPTAKEGVYHFVSGIHNSGDTEKRHPGLFIGNYYEGSDKNQTIPVTRGEKRTASKSDQINIHIGYGKRGWSDGCLTILRKDYDKFAKSVGFKKDDIKVDRGGYRYKKVSGYIVIDRTNADYFTQ
ncbi:hypothetical protein AN1V17_10680 [Vallitalea sediminicola]